MPGQAWPTPELEMSTAADDGRRERKILPVPATREGPTGCPAGLAAGVTVRC